jgi:hypothetical protein
MLYRPDATFSSPLPGEFENRASRRKRRSRRNRSSRRYFEHGYRRAVWRAFTAAERYAQGEAHTLHDAAESCGSNVRYVVAALKIQAVEDLDLEMAILADKVRLLDAAAALTPLANLMVAAAAADADTKVAFARAISPEVLWDSYIVPALGNEGTVSTVDSSDDDDEPAAWWKELHHHAAE